MTSASCAKRSRPDRRAGWKHPGLLLLGVGVFASGCPSGVGQEVASGSTGSGSSTSSASASTSTTGTGAAGVCTPGATQQCYDGPTGTEGVGICQSGMQTCAEDGASWGECLGEVLPQTPNCASGKDLHCDGQVPVCKGSVLWAKRFGDASNQYAGRVTADSSGNVLIAGTFSGSVDFGGGPLSASGTSGYVAKLDGATGDYVWAHSYGGSADVAVDASSNVFVTGYFSGSADFGQGPVASIGETDAFVLALQSGGDVLWLRHFGAPGLRAGGARIVTDASGNLLVAGTFSGSVDFGNGQPVSSVGGQDIFVLKLGAEAGGYVWVKDFGAPGSQGGVGAANDLALDASGNVALVGTFVDTIDFDGHVLSGPSPLFNTFVLKLSSAGVYAWSKALVGTDAETGAQGEGIAADGLGGVYVTGNFSGSVDFGNGSAIPATGSSDAFLLKLDTNGDYEWVEHFSADSAFIDGAEGAGVTVDSAGNLIATGQFVGAVQFPGRQPVSGSGGDDLFLAKLDPTAGGDVWGETFGNASSAQTPASVATDPAQNVVVAGYFSGSVDFGQGPLASAGGNDIFVAKLSP